MHAFVNGQCTANTSAGTFCTQTQITALYAHAHVYEWATMMTMRGRALWSSTNLRTRQGLCMHACVDTPAFPKILSNTLGVIPGTQVRP